MPSLSIAIKLAIRAIFSGVEVILRAVAPGIISRAVISNTPIIFIVMAITRAVINISAVRVLLTLIPLLRPVLLLLSC